MKRMVLYFKSIGYSARLIYRSSKLWIIPFFFTELITATVGLFNAYVLKSILDELAAPDISMSILALVGVYILALVLKQAFSSVQSILSDMLIQKAVFRYDLELLDKLSSLPLYIMDSSEGRDMIDDVNFARYAAVNAVRSSAALTVHRTVIHYRSPSTPVFFIEKKKG